MIAVYCWIYDYYNVPVVNKSLLNKCATAASGGYLPKETWNGKYQTKMECGAWLAKHSRKPNKTSQPNNPPF